MGGEISGCEALLEYLEQIPSADHSLPNLGDVAVDVTTMFMTEARALRASGVWAQTRISRLPDGLWVILDIVRDGQDWRTLAIRFERTTDQRVHVWLSDDRTGAVTDIGAASILESDVELLDLVRAGIAHIREELWPNTPNSHRSGA
jgi:hypothetical protein